MQREHLRFDRNFLIELRKITKRYLAGEQKTSIILLSLITLCIIISVRAMVELNEFSRDFFNALQAFNTSLILHLCLRLTVVVTILVISLSYNSYFMGLLTIKWRKNATEYYLEKWIIDKNYYFSTFKKGKIDNPDQRIANDLNEFPEATVLLYSLILNSILMLISFGCTLWKASVPLSVGATTIKVPGFFCLCAVAFAAIGTWLTNHVGKRLPGLLYQQERTNAHFRFELIRLQEANEEIALYKGEAAENRIVSKRFATVIKNALLINKLKKNLAIFNNAYVNIGSLLGTLIATPFFLTKQINMGTFMLVSGAFGYTIKAFSIFVSVFELLSGWRAAIRRLIEFDNLVTKEYTSYTLNVSIDAGNSLLIQQCSLATPQQEPLLRDININFSPGNSYLLKGRIGSGKSTLFKAIAGLWPHGRGEIKIPKQASLWFCPQKPHIVPGTLLENIIYPSLQLDKVTCLEEILKQVRLAKYLNMLEINQDWRKILSIGEQQLISFARIFYNRPDIILLDESTSALDEISEAHIYTALRQQLPNAIIISIGHRKTLPYFHDHVLDFSSRQIENLPSFIEI